MRRGYDTSGMFGQPQRLSLRQSRDFSATSPSGRSDSNLNARISVVLQVLSLQDSDSNISSLEQADKCALVLAIVHMTFQVLCRSLFLSKLVIALFSYSYNMQTVNERVDLPVVFCISKPNEAPVTHSSVLEFTAPEGFAYLSHWVICTCLFFLILIR